MRYRPHRWPSRLPVRISGGSDSFDALLVNVSREGARLSKLPEGALAPGSTVTLTASGLSLKAEIRWRERDSGGLSFSAPLAVPTLTRLRQGVAGTRG